MVHFHYKDKPYSEFAKRDEHNNFIFNPNAFWINDFYVFGKFDIIKKFVNLFVKDNYSYPHFPIWEVISENNIKIKNHVLKGFLVRDANIEFVNNFTLQNQKFNPIGLLTGPDY